MKSIKWLLVLFASLFAGFSANAQATDIPSTVSTLSGYWTTIEVLAITVVVFVIGLRLLRKIR